MKRVKFSKIKKIHRKILLSSMNYQDFYQKSKPSMSSTPQSSTVERYLIVNKIRSRVDT